jgi:hypothetical protein
MLRALLEIVSYSKIKQGQDRILPSFHTRFLYALIAKM